MIEVELPDGRILEVDAPDAQAAASAAKAFLQKSATPQQPEQPAAPKTETPAPVAEQPQEKSGYYPGPGVQGAARAAADVVGLPFDMANMAANAIIAPVDYASRKLGGPEIPFRFGMVSDSIAKAASALADKLGIRTEDPANMNFKDRALYEGNRFGTQAAATLPALLESAARRAPEIAKSVPRLGDEFLRPYFKEPTKTAAGDVATGAGAGTALAAEQTLVPEDVRKKGGGTVGAGLDLMAMLTGAHGTGTLYKGAVEGPKAVFDSLRQNPIVEAATERFTGVPAEAKIAADPETGLPIGSRVTDKAAKSLQGAAIDPEQAADTITRVAQEYKDAGLPIPTSGIISGDTGLEGVERGQRTKLSTGSLLQDGTPEAKSKYSFGERDTALRDAAVNEVNSVRPEGANPEAFPKRAEAIDEMLSTNAQRQADKAAGRERGVQIAREGEGADLQQFQGRGGGASANIDEMYRGTRDTELRRNNENYANPELESAPVPVAPLRQAADTVAAQATPLAPVDPVVQQFVDRIRAVEGENTTMGDVNRLRADIEGAIQQNLSNGRITRELRQLKDATSAYVGQLAESGNQAAQEAVTNYAQRVAPNFRQGAGGKLDQRIKRDNTEYGLRPSETAETFLARPEDAADLMRISRLGGREAETAANARTWLFDQLSRTGVVGSDGTINAGRLTRWRNINGDLLDQVPNLRAEVDDMVTRARNGETLAGEAATSRAAAEQNVLDTRKSLDSGPLGLVTGKDPAKAVASVLSSGNPVENMRALREQVGKNSEAAAGLKAAVADHLANRVLTADPKSETGQSVSFAKLSKEFEKNRDVMVAAGFTPEEMNALQRAQKAIEPLSRRSGQATVGSQTAESGAGIWRPVEIMVRTYYGALEGGSIMRKFKLIAGPLIGDDTAAVNRLVARAMFDPELAATLLTRDVKDVGGPAWNARLQKAIRRVQAAKDVLGGNDSEN